MKKINIARLFEYSLIQKIRVGFITGLMFLILISVLSYVSISNVIEFLSSVNKTNEIILKLEKLHSTLKSLEAGQVGFIITNDPSYIKNFTQAVKSIETEYCDLTEQLNDNKIQEYRLSEMKKLIDKRLKIIWLTLKYQSEDKNISALRVVKSNEGKLLMEVIKKRILIIQNTEEKILYERKNNLRLNTNFTFYIIIIGNITAITLTGVSLFYILRDIKIKKAAEIDFIERQNKLQELNKELESFSYTISHDLRSPLRAIDGFGRILAEDYHDILDDEGSRILNVIRDNARRMGVLIDDLLAFSRITRKEINRSQIGMKGLVARVLKDLENDIGKHKANIIVSDLLNAYGEPSLIYQVWQNLISNAIKFSSKKDSPEIKISSVMNEEEVEYCIEDNGAGFDEQYKQKLFGIFQRLHSEKDFDGTGVGLAIVHRIVTKHDGRIWAESELNKGARFYFTLPSS